MFKIVEIETLRQYSIVQIDAYRVEAENRKAELENLKADGGDSWTEATQEELDNIALLLVDIADVCEEKIKNSPAHKVTSDSTFVPAYTPKEGTEKLVHIQLVQGRRFNPHTGEEESKVRVQMFTYPEWQVFKKNIKNLGYTVVQVLHDPYGEAKEFTANK